MNEHIIEFCEVNKNYGKKQVLKNFTTKIRRGKITGLLGRNGAGKSTIMKLLVNNTLCQSGSIKINGSDLSGDVLKENNIGMLIENTMAYDYLTGKQNLELFNMNKDANKTEYMDELIEEMSLHEFIDDKVKNYSVGMLQRLGISMALINNPDIVILDEPFNGLDPISIKKLRSKILALKDEGKTVIVSSHLIREISTIVDDVIIIDKGQLKANKEVSKDENFNIEEFEDFVLNLM